MVWILSDLATKKVTWNQALNVMTDHTEWEYFEGNKPEDIVRKIRSLNKEQLLQYEVLFKLMTVLYHKGRINKIGWDLHTENAMMRDDGTIVITDPWFAMSTD
jgi:hypothetical protein